MRHFALLFALLALTGSGAHAEAHFAASVLTVSGEGVVTRPPDIATLNVSIETNADSASAAVSDNNRKFDDLKGRMHAMGVAEGDINASTYSVNFNPPQPPTLSEGAAVARPIPYPNPQRYGYVVTRSITIKLRNINDAGKAIDESVAAGATNIYGVQFSVSDQRSVYAAALRSAVEDAQSQARAMAQAAHMRILRIKSMQSGYSPGPIMMRGTAQRSAPIPAQGVPTVIKPENLDVRANVTIVYEVGAG
ncbi:MAG: SIMPL domain-containing protein [Candidatus Eremiobacteraeota bacterium]|nr:SIMPL domain-containing protein [Candidatus Eremiobacteraeota bacterium]